VRKQKHVQPSSYLSLLPHLVQPSPPTLFLIFFLGALVLTYPLVLHLSSHIPLGAEPAGTVPLFNLWTLQWNIDQLMQGYPNYWNAPIFAPNKGTFAFSETQPLSALLATPLWLGLTSPAVGYNAVVILFLTLNGWFTYWLLKSWGVSSWSALPAGLLMQALPFVAQEMGVLQLIAIFGFLWSFLFISRFLKQSKRGQVEWQTMICLALGPPVTFFTCGYYGLFSVLFLPLVFLAQVRPNHVNLKTGGQLLAIGFLIIVSSAPFLLAQRRHLEHYGFTRSTKTIENNSAKLTYYFNFLDHNIFYGRVLGLESDRGQRLFPGLVIIFLASLGLFPHSKTPAQREAVTPKHKSPPSFEPDQSDFLRLQKQIKVYLVVSVGLALLLSMGLRLQLGNFQPYQWIRAYVPGFNQLRSPFRFAVLVQIHLVLLAGWGLFNLKHWFPTYGRLILITLTGLALLESMALPLPLQPLPTRQTNASWQAWLNQQERAPEIIMLPFAASKKAADFEQTTRWMLESRYFQGDMLNGYSGFFPPGHTDLREQMLQFPTSEGIDLLRQMQVDYVIVHHNLSKAPRAKTIIKYLPLVYEDQPAGVAIYALKPPE
jgi:hypothetical protein